MIKKIFCSLSFSILALCSSSMIANANDQSLRVVVDSVELKFTGHGAYLSEVTPMLPAKEILEKFEVEVKWDSQSNTLQGYQYGSLRIELKPDNEVGKFDGKPILIDSPPKVINGTLMIPSSLITQLFNYDVKFEPFANVIIIDKNQIVTVDPYQSYQKKYVEKEQFTKTLSPFMNKTIWSSTGIVGKDANGKIVILDKFSPVYIVKVEQGSPYKIQIKSGDKNVWLDYVDSNYFYSNFHLNNPRTSYKFTNEIWAKIMSNKVEVGMNQDMVTLSIGAPEKVNTLKSASGTMEQWVYELSKNGKTSGFRYLHFHNGTLTSIDTTNI